MSFFRVHRHLGIRGWRQRRYPDADRRLDRLGRRPDRNDDFRPRQHDQPLYRWNPLCFRIAQHHLVEFGYCVRWQSRHFSKSIFERWTFSGWSSSHSRGTEQLSTVAHCDPNGNGDSASDSSANLDTDGRPDSDWNAFHHINRNRDSGSKCRRDADHRADDRPDSNYH